MNQGISYDQIALSARYFSGNSRRDTNILPKEIAGFCNSHPLIPANMATTISFELAEKLAESEYFYILHRFYDYDEIFNWVVKNTYKFLTSISVGIQEKDFDLINRFIVEAPMRKYPDVITIDVAHGDCIGVKNMIQAIKKLDNDIFIIAGNVMTPEACIRLKMWGADGIKIGLSMGKACTTYNNTGVGSPMYSTVLECRKWLEKVFIDDVPVIIADGGIREFGDIAKAIHAGADYVMAGSMFVKCVDSPTEHLNDKSLYFGSASKRNKGKDEFIEGDSEQWIPEYPEKWNYMKVFDKTKEALQSTISYSGGTSLYDIRKMETNLIK